MNCSLNVVQPKSIIGGITAEQKMEGATKEEEKGLRDMRVIVVANRLPISVSQEPKTGKWTFEMSSGGLVTALKGIRDELDFKWIGWIGKQVPEEVRVRYRVSDVDRDKIIRMLTVNNRRTPHNC